MVYNNENRGMSMKGQTGKIAKIGNWKIHDRAPNVSRKAVSAIPAGLKM